MQNRALAVYDGKDDALPKHVICLTGLYFKMLNEKGMYGIKIFSDRP